MRSVFVSVAALVLAVPVIAQKADPAARPLIGGAWTLNREQSTAPRGGGADPGDRMHGGGGMRGGFGGMGSGMRGGTGQPPDREEMERRRTLMKEVLEAAKAFVITVEEPLVTFTYSDGRVVRYKTDGKEERHQFTSGTVKTKAKWEVDRLTIEIDLGDGFKLTNAFKVTPDPRQLIVSTTMPGQSKDLPPITRVYDETLQ